MRVEGLGFVSRGVGHDGIWEQGPFRVLDKRTVGKILQDDWTESEPATEQGEQPNAVTS